MAKIKIDEVRHYQSVLKGVSALCRDGVEFVDKLDLEDEDKNDPIKMGDEIEKTSGAIVELKAYMKWLRQSMPSCGPST